MAALPACGPKSGDDDSPVATAERFTANCEQAFTAYYACDGYNLDSEQQALLEEYCSEYLGYVQEVGDGCVTAYAGYFACISDLDCTELEDSGELCTSEIAKSLEECASQCGSQSISYSGGSGCGLEASECLDGRDYAVQCVPASAMGTIDCDCTIDGASTQTFSTEAGTCGGDFGMFADEACGFVPGTFG